MFFSVAGSKVSKGIPSNSERLIIEHFLYLSVDQDNGASGSDNQSLRQQVWQWTQHRFQSFDKGAAFRLKVLQGVNGDAGSSVFKFLSAFVLQGSESVCGRLIAEVSRRLLPPEN